MSRTGNLLFPEDQDGGWVASIQKALPKEHEKENSEDALGGIPDPVADAADAAFAEVAAEVAAKEAIFAAGWSADAVKAEPQALERPDPAREAIESVVNPEVEGGEDLDFGEDPVAVEADAAFAEISAETAARDAIEAAGWTAEASLPAIDLAAQEIAPAATLQPGPEEADFAGWSAASVRSKPDILPPQELEALDAIVAEVGQTKRFLEIEDPVGFAADAVFAETAAQVAEREAARAARKEDEEDRAAALAATREQGPEAVPGPRRTLSAEEQMPLENDPVALEADAAFTKLAADVAIDDAILAARWHARPGPDDVVVALGEKPDPAKSPDFEKIPDLVRAEAEIAFDDAAYDLAYSTVDSLVSGEAAALEAFDQAIQSGADPEEALAAAITAAEAVDPAAFGLTQVAARPIEPDDFIFAALGNDEPGTFPRPARGRDVATDSEKERDGAEEKRDAEGDEEIFAATLLGQGFNDDPARLRGAEDGAVDVLLGTGYTFVFDPDLISVPAPGQRVRDRDGDLVAGTDAEGRIDGTNGPETLTGSTGSDNIFGYAGDDVLVGGQGDDRLTGGAGADEFRFAGGTGADALAKAVSLGTDTVTDFSAADGDTFGLSNADFGFGDAGTLTDGVDYYEYVATTLGGAPLDVSGGSAGAAIVVIGDGSGTDGVGVYYTEDASAMTTDNSYQIADVDGINTGDIGAGDFSLKS